MEDEDSEIGAVCYAKVRPTENAFVGVAAAEELVQGATVFDGPSCRKYFDEVNFPDWKSIIQHWKSSISATAISLKNGDAAVTYESENRLSFCDVTPLLRLPERKLQFERQHNNEGKP